MTTSTTPQDGLSDADLWPRRERDGANALCAPRNTPSWPLLVTQRTHFSAGMLTGLAGLLVVFLGLPWLSELLGGAWPSATGWLFCLLAVVTVPVVDAAHKLVARRRRAR